VCKESHDEKHSISLTCENA